MTNRHAHPYMCVVWQSNSKNNSILQESSNSSSSSISLQNVPNGNSKPTWIPAGLIWSKAPTVLKTNFTTLLKLSSPILQEASVKNTMSALAPLHTESPRKGMLKIHQPHHHEINIASKFENSRMTNIQQMSTTTQSKWHMTSARYKKNY